MRNGNDTEQAKVDPWALFTHEQLDRIFRQTMRKRRCGSVTTASRELLARDRERKLLPYGR